MRLEPSWICIGEHLCNILSLNVDAAQAEPLCKTVRQMAEICYRARERQLGAGQELARLARLRAGGGS